MTLLVASGCANAGSTDPGCGECVEELAAVRTEIEALPDVKKLVTLNKYPSSPTNGATVDVELDSKSVGDSGVVEEVARIVWQSELTPVDWVEVVVEDASGELVHGDSPFHFLEQGREYESYVEQWGPRPVEE